MVITLLSCSIPTIASEDINPGIFTKAPISLPPGLSVEEYLLKKEPEGNALKPFFDPVISSVKEIQKRHNKERRTVESKMGNSGAAFTVADEDLRQAILRNEPIFARQESTSTGSTVSIGKEKIAAKTVVIETGEWTNKISVQLTRKGKAILNLPVGDNSPIEPIQGLWTYRNHWVLEVAHSKNKTVTGERFDLNGEIIQDGESFSKRHSYQETFGFQLMRGKPFYFFRKDNQIGVSFDNQEVRLGYSEIPHYRCCEPSMLNPDVYKNMVSFFARRNDRWYYVEIGVFKK